MQHKTTGNTSQTVLFKEKLVNYTIRGFPHMGPRRGSQLLKRTAQALVSSFPNMAPVGAPKLKKELDDRTLHLIVEKLNQKEEHTKK